MKHVKFYQASSSEMFGSSYDTCNDGEKYQNENTKFMPNSPYAIAKCAAHYAVRLYRDAYSLHASSGILFNHEGPRRGENFVTQKVIKWITDFIHWRNSHENPILFFSDDYIIIHNDKFPKLRLGNLEAYRDWGYAGDYVEAMWLMLQQDIPEDYVICTGETHTIAEFLNIAFYSAGITDYRNLYVIDQEFYRPSEVDYLRGDCSKAKNKLGWQPKTNLEGLVKLMLDAKLQANN